MKLNSVFLQTTCRTSLGHCKLSAKTAIMLLVRLQCRPCQCLDVCATVVNGCSLLRGVLHTTPASFATLPSASHGLIHVGRAALGGSLLVSDLAVCYITVCCLPSCCQPI